MGVGFTVSAVQRKRPKPKARKQRLVVPDPVRRSERDDIGNHSSKVDRVDVLNPHLCVYYLVTRVFTGHAGTSGCLLESGKKGTALV